MNAPGSVTIVQGYVKTFYVNLWTDEELPFDLTGVTQVAVALPGAVAGQPVVEYLASVATLTTTASTTSGSNQLTSLAMTAGLAPGQTVTGTGIPVGTVVTAVNVAAASATMSQNATATAVGVTVAATTAANVTVSGAPGAGRLQVALSAYDSARLAVNPYPPQLQDMQVVVTMPSGVTVFFVPSVLDVVAPPYGVV